MNQNPLYGYTLAILPQVEKDLLKIDKKSAAKIKQKVQQLVGEVPASDIKKMKGLYKFPTYRMRCGDFRVIYQVHKKEITVLVVEVGHRREVYRR